MNRDQLQSLLENGENSGLEWKRDDLTGEKLAKELAALLNLEGGHILLGVEDDGTVSGLARSPADAERWVMEVARTHLRPPAIPYWETILWDQHKVVGVITVSADAPDKPYKVKRGSAWVTQVRVGTTSRDASDDEEARLYQQSGRIQYDRRPLPGSSPADLDFRRLRDYFANIRRQDHPAEHDADGWQRLLINTEILTEDRGRALVGVGGMLLFGLRPSRFLPNAGINAAAYQGTVKDYDAKERTVLRGPLVGLFAADGSLVESGIIEQALEFVRRNTRMQAHTDEHGRRQERWDYPLDAVREAVVNAVAHRDYTIHVADIELSLFADRIEVLSPGRLPNTVTVDKMRAGYRASRNELIKEVLRDYRYVEANGLGVPRKIIAGMRAHNGTEPELVEEDERFLVRLWREAKTP
ncbi:MAG: ATP-binding protein [Planctomycetota bacterium]